MSRLTCIARRVWNWSLLLLTVLGAVSGAYANGPAVASPKVPATPEISEQFQKYLPQIREFIAYNAARLRSEPLLQSELVFGSSVIEGISTTELAGVKKNLAFFGVDISSVGASPNFLFVTAKSADDLRDKLLALGVSRERASIEASVYLQSPDTCYLEALSDPNLDAVGLLLAVARAGSTSPTPGTCLNNTVLNALGLYKSLEQFGPVEAGPLSRSVDADFVDRVSKCKAPSKNQDEIAECVLSSYPFPKKL